MEILFLIIIGVLTFDNQLPSHNVHLNIVHDRKQYRVDVPNIKTCDDLVVRIDKALAFCTTTDEYRPYYKVEN